MAIATELNINTSATALDMANAIFGNGIQVISATYTGAAISSGTYTGALSTLGHVATGGLVNSDTGVILSTGNVTDFTNSSGTTNTNEVTNRSTDTTGGVDGDAQLNAVAGMATFDGAILTATFIPDGNMITMQFVFSSEEFPEYISSNVNDAFGVWVNGTFVPVSVTVGGNVAIDEINQNRNQNLYRDNTQDQFNTEMDGVTRILSFKAPVIQGQVNTIKIGIADGGDAIFDSNLLIMGDSIQTFALAIDDTIQLTANSSRTFDILANDRDLTNSGLTITHINGTAVVAGQTVTLGTGEQVRLNADGTVTVFSDGDIGSNALNYTIVDSQGNSDVGFITIKTVAATTPDGIVQGTSGADTIQVGYLGDPDGDRIDNNDGLGVGGTTGNADYVMAGAGNDLVLGNLGNDVIYAGTGDDTVFGGAGDDWVSLGDGNDSFGTFGTDSAGNDTIYGEAGNDYIIGGGDNDLLYGGTGNDTLSGGVGNDTMYGGDGADQFNITDDHQGDTIYGGEGGNDNDVLAFANFATTAGITVTATGAEAGTYAFNSAAGATGTYSEIEIFSATDYNDTLNFAADGSGVTLVGNGGDDSITAGSGDDLIYGGVGNDTVRGGAGADTILGDAGNDTLYGEAGNDSISGGAGNDVIYGGLGADTLSGGDDADVFYGGAGDVVVGGEGGTDNDTLVLNYADVQSISYGGGNNEAGTVTFYGGGTLTFSEIENIAFIGPVDGTNGNDTMVAGYTDVNGDQVDGTDGLNDLIFGNGGNDSINAGAGADTVYGGTGNDTIDGGAGQDSLHGDAGNDVISTGIDTVNDVAYGGLGDDTIYGGGGIDALFGDEGNDTIIVGATGQALVYGGDGDDSITGSALMDQLIGDDGNDTIRGGGGNDLISGDAGDDLLFGDAGDDEIAGGAGNDVLYGGTGSDTLYGGAGADVIYGGAGDVVVGGEGGTDNDTLVLNYADVQSISYGGGNNEAGTVTFNAGGTLTFSEIENIAFIGPVDGTNGNDTMVAGYTDVNGDQVDGTDGVNDLIFGYGGNDWIEATNGNDTVYGGTGNDTIYGGTGSNVLHGDEGNDFIWTDNSNDTLAGLNDTLYGGAGDDTLYSRYGDDLLYGGSGNDVIHGGPGADTAYGGDGDDQLNGGADAAADLFYGDAGNDELRGDDGSDSLYGGADNDLIYGGGDDDLIDGGTGQDSLYGDGGNDTILGDAGNDELTGGEGDDSLDGGADQDSLYGDAGNDTLLGGSGNDLLFGGANNDLLYGGDGNDVLEGDEGNDILLGDAGNDSLYGGIGNDILTGGAGNDSMVGGDDADTFYAGAGDTVVGGEGATSGTDNDTLVLNFADVQSISYGGGNNEAGTVTFYGGGTLTFSEIENITFAGPVDGTSGGDLMGPNYTDLNGDQIDGADGVNDTILGHGGNDTIIAGIGNDTIYGGTGDDSVEGGAGSNLIYGDEGNDTLSGGGWVGNGNDTIYGGVGDDVVYGGEGNDLLDLGDGDDRSGTYGSDSDGDDTIYGGAGNDMVIAGAGNDLVYGGSGNDTIDGAQGNDIVHGDAGNDLIYVATGNDTVYGGDDADIVRVWTGLGPDWGINTFIGGEGGIDQDVIDLEQLTTDSTVIFTGNEAGTVSSGLGSATFSQFEQIVLGSGNDTVDASATTVGVQVAAGAGNDVLIGGAGNDMLDGGQGDDRFVLNTGFGADLILGGETGETSGDTLDGSALTGDVVLDLSAGSASNPEDGTLTQGGNVATFAQIETFVLGSGNDLVIGSSGNDVVFTGAGNDTVAGGAGNDVFDLGSAGGDADVVVLADGDGDDTISGFEAPTDNGDGTFTGRDRLDVTGLTDSSGNPVNTDDVVVSDDGNGNAVLTFPNGESVTLIGVDPMDVATRDQLAALGIPYAPDLIVDGTEGADSMSGGYTDIHGDQVDGTDGDHDTIFGYGGNDTIQAGAGDDLAYGGTGVDQVEGGAGNDTLYGDAGSDTVYGGTGNDALYGGDDDDSVLGGLGDDLLSGDAGNDVLWGDEGDDTLYGGAGDDVLSGGDNDDLLYGGIGEDLLVGDAGNDTLEGEAGDDKLYGGQGDDSLTGGNGHDWLMGDDGDDVLSGDAGDDLLYGGTGADTLLGGSGNDGLYGGLGDDSLSGDEGQDTLHGDGGNDLLQGGSGNDQIYGGAGNDTLIGDAPGMTGQPAPGTFSFGLFAINSGGMPINNWVTAVNGTSTFNGSADVTTVTVTDDDSAFEDYGTGGGSPVDGSAPQVLTSAVTITKIIGYSGGVPVYGTVTFPAGTPIFAVAQSDITNVTTGESGNAWVIQIGYDNTNVFYAYDIAVHDGDTLTWLSDNGGSQTPMFANVAGLQYTDLVQADGQPLGFDDTLDGGDGDDLIDGNLGNDLLYGGTGNDTLNGGDGDDTAEGGAGNDSIDGGDGNDLLLGGSGNDTLAGGDGADSMDGGDDRDLFFGGIGDVVDGGEGGDDYDVLDLTAWGHPATNIIYDVNNPENGTVEFLDANGNVVGTMSFTNIEKVVACFTPGAMILTDMGEVAVEDLRIGDRVLTRDNGYQTIRWTGRRDLSHAELIVEPRFNPVFIARGALGAGLPERDMMVSPQHRMLITGPKAELLFGEHEVLVAAKHLVGMAGIEQRVTRGVSYLHILFDQHEILRADGAWSESFQPGHRTLEGLDGYQRDEILSLFPELAQGETFQSARLTLKAKEARALMQA